MAGKRKDGYVVYKSHAINALLPQFLRHLFWNLIIFAILFAVYSLVDIIFTLDWWTPVLLWGILLVVAFSILKIFRDVLRVVFTEFRFYPQYVERRYKFLREKIHSVRYTNITDIKVERSVWDRVCGVGDLVFHTANEAYGDSSVHALVLKDIKHPHTLRDELDRRIHPKVQS